MAADDAMKHDVAAIVAELDERGYFDHTFVRGLLWSSTVPMADRRLTVKNNKTFLDSGPTQPRIEADESNTLGISFGQ